MTTISQNGGTVYIRYDNVGTLIQYSSNNIDWTTMTSFPVSLNNTNELNDIMTVQFTTDITLSSADNYFIINSNNITIDGMNHTITMDGVSHYLGLIQHRNGHYNITVKNIIIATANVSTLEEGAGWIGQSYFAQNGSINNLIENCTNYGEINNYNAGGIVGSRVAHHNGILTINYCVNHGTIVRSNSGGIVGSTAAEDAGTLILSHCTNIGDIIDSSCGGIIGQGAGQTNGNININHCTNSGIVSGGSSGGIAGSTLNNATVSDCINTGSISGNEAGGIVGSSCGTFNGSVTISNSYSTGSISGNGAGGIVGSACGSFDGFVTISNSYSTGSISGTYAGGIIGKNISAFTMFLGSSTCTVSVSNCYSNGTIATTCGGIIGGFNCIVNQIPTVTINNCYSSGALSDANSGILAVSLTTAFPTQIIPTHCYVANNAWSNATANSFLTGTPTGGSSFGTTWSLHNSIFPYYLTVFAAISTGDQLIAFMTNSDPIGTITSETIYIDQSLINTGGVLKSIQTGTGPVKIIYSLIG